VHLIPLRARGKGIVEYALVDAEDYERVAAMRWHRHQYGGMRYPYARHCRGFYMHRFILGLEKGDRRIVDHVNRNGLDNRKTNLRVGTQLDNMQNRIGRVSSTSPHRGVSYDARPGPLANRWCARVKIRGKPTWVGRFATEEEAAEAAARAREAFLAQV